MSRPAGVAAPTAADLALSVASDGLLSIQGAVDTQGAANGDFALRSSDARSFLRWFGAIVPALPPFDVPFTRFDLAGHAALGAARVEVTALRANIDRSTLTGRASFVPAQDRRAPRFEAVLTAPALDLDALPDLAQVGTAVRGIDLAVTFDAQATRVARVGLAQVGPSQVGPSQVAAGRISLAFQRTGEDFTLERLALDGIGGATLRASARGNGRMAHVETVLEARQLGDLSALLRRVAPGAWTEAFATRAGLLTPATVTLQLDAAGETGALAPTRLAVTGKLADTALQATLSPTSDGVAGALALDAPEAAPFLRQLGWPVIPLRGQGPGRLEARLTGRSDAPFATTATMTVAGATAQFDGAVRLDAETTSATGALKIRARDLGPLLRIVAAPVDAFGGWPVDVRTQIDAQNGRVAMQSIDGTIAGSDVSGALERRIGTAWTGALRLGQLDVASLAAVLLGPAPTTTPKQGLAVQKFATQPNDPPAADIDLTVSRLLLAGATGTNAAGRLSIGPGVIGVQNLSVDVAGGTLSGNAMLRRQEGTASLAATLAAKALAFARPWGAAAMSGDIDVKGAGTSLAELAGTLAGRGQVRLDGGSLARLAADAPVLVAQAVDAERIPLDPAAIQTALAMNFDAASQRLPIVDAPLAIEAGALSFGPVDLALPSGRALVSARYDLARDRIGISETLQSVPPADWTGSPPRVDLTLSGPAAGPLARTIDATDLISTLAAHGLAREEALRAALDADRRERAFFSRRLRKERAEDTERRAEQARLEAARLEAVRQEDAARQELARREVLRQREAERLSRERQRMERQSDGPTAPLDLRPPAAFVPTPGRTPNLIAPDPGTAGRY